MRVCEVCGKRSVIQKSGAHQYGGGWAMRATKKRKVWQVNLHNVKVNYKGVRRTMRLCTKCLRKVKSSALAKTSADKQDVKSKVGEEKLIMPIIKESSQVV